MTRCAICNHRRAYMLYRSRLTDTVEPMCEICVEKLDPKPDGVCAIA